MLGDLIGEAECILVLLHYPHRVTILTRGLLLFGESLPINEDGWKWLNRMIGRAYRGRELDTQLGFNSEDLEVWSDIQDN